jgi:hypothetical protein
MYCKKMILAELFLLTTLSFVTFCSFYSNFCYDFPIFTDKAVYDQLYLIKFQLAFTTLMS